MEEQLIAFLGTGWRMMNEVATLVGSDKPAVLARQAELTELLVGAVRKELVHVTTGNSAGHYFFPDEMEAEMAAYFERLRAHSGTALPEHEVDMDPMFIRPGYDT
jgi:hypothetical protein